MAQASGAIGVREIDENAIALAELATGLAEQGGADETTDLLGRLQAIESTMRDDFVLAVGRLGWRASSER